MPVVRCTASSQGGHLTVTSPAPVTLRCGDRLDITLDPEPWNLRRAATTLAVVALLGFGVYVMAAAAFI